MGICGISNNIYRKPDSETLASKASDTYKAAYRAASKAACVEISPEAYEAHADDEKLTATSGKDTLGITKGSKEGSFGIHFSDSAMVSRAVSRGYITVNGTKVELTDDIKQQLTRIDQQAQADRERAFNKYIMQRELAVAQQQGESYKKMAEGMSKAFETAAKLSKGGKVSPSEEQQLMETNPQLYTMSKFAALMAKEQGKQHDEVVQAPEMDKEASQTAASDERPSIEWKSYETRLTVSLSDTVQFQGVSESEIDLKA